MAVFRYKMQNILNIKCKLETQAKMAFAAAAAALAAEEEKLLGLRTRRGQYEEEAKRLRCQRLDIDRINQCQRAIEAMKELIRRQQVSVHIAQRNVETARARLNEVMVERKTYEKLKEHALEAFLQEQASAEGKEIDQLVSYAYQGRMAEV